MKALLVAVGTRGDVHPALGLAVALKSRGHAVRMCISPNFVDLAGRLGIDAVPLGVEMRMPASKAAATPSLTPEELRKLRESMPDLITDQFDTIGKAAVGCDVIVGANAHQYAAPSIAAHLGIGCVTAVYAPVAVPTPDLAPPPLPFRKDDALASSAAIDEQWRVTVASWNERALERINRNRARLDQAPITDVLDYVLTDHTWLAADAVLAPIPSTPGRTLFQTGAWTLADSTPLPADLDDFLRAGEPPVFVGFGSMPAARDVSSELVAAVRAQGRRMLLSQGWAGLDIIDRAADVMLVGDVSHDVLFPRVAAVVHHGGAGTTATAARAGVPQIVTPMFGDQFYWASRLVTLGVGSTTPHTSLSAASLSAALHDALDPAVAHRAQVLATQVRADGVDVAVQRLEADFGYGG